MASSSKSEEMANESDATFLRYKYDFFYRLKIKIKKENSYIWHFII